MVESDGELEGVYRLLGNDEIEAEAILAPHIAATFKRAKEVPLCLIVHDTTEFKFNGQAEREDGQRIRQGLVVLELPRLIGATRLQGLEVLLNCPPRSTAIDDLQGSVLRYR